MTIQPGLPLDIGMPILDDKGYVGGGVSGARAVTGEDQCDYLIKGPSIAQCYIWTAANELIAAKLGELLGLPVLTSRVLSTNGNLFFGSQWMAPTSFKPWTEEPMFDKCENKHRVYDISAFDAYIFNIDRHQGNLLVRNFASNPAGRHTLLLNDHSHCLARPNISPAELLASVNDFHQNFFQIPFVLNKIVDPRLLSESISNIERITEQNLSVVVNNVPDSLLGQPEKAIIIAYLTERRNILRQLFNNYRHFFPALQGGQI